MELSFDVEVSLKDLRRYMYIHKYKRMTGVTELLLGVICLVIGLCRYNAVGEDYSVYMLFLIFFGVFFLIISPIQTAMNCVRQYVSNPTYQEPIHYTLNDEGIVISQGDISDSLPWGQVYRVTDNGKAVVFYVNKNCANILPKRCLGDKTDEVKEFFRSHLSEKCVKL